MDQVLLSGWSSGYKWIYVSLRLRGKASAGLIISVCESRFSLLWLWLCSRLCRTSAAAASSHTHINTSQSAAMICSPPGGLRSVWVESKAGGGWREGERERERERERVLPVH